MDILKIVNLFDISCKHVEFLLQNCFNELNVLTEIELGRITTNKSMKSYFEKDTQTTDSSFNICAFCHLTSVLNFVCHLQI